MASPRPEAQAEAMPTDLVPTATFAEFAKSTKKVVGQTTKVKDAGGGVVTRIINQTVTTGKSKFRSSSSPSALKGKIAGIVVGILAVILIIAVILILLHKRKQKKRGIVSAEDKEPGDLETETEAGNEKKVDEVEGVGAGGSGGNPYPVAVPAPTVPGEMAYGSEPAHPLPVAGSNSAPLAQPIQNVSNTNATTSNK